jgi:PKHD-type hydroxylase
MSTFITPTEEIIRPWPLTSYTFNNFAQYIQYFNADECKQYIRDGKENERTTLLKKGEVGNAEANTNFEVRNSDVCFFKAHNPANNPLFSKLTEVLVNANQSFFEYDIFDIEAVQFSTYSAGYDGFYTKHMDTTTNSSATGVRKLSFSVQLSPADSYEGGDLLLHTDMTPTVAPRELGSLIIFPSFTLHEVTPVTEGVRYSLVGWVTGPAWK